MSERKLTAKQYLEQLKDIDEMIQQDLERLEGMKQDAFSIKGIDYSRDRVQTSHMGDKLCNDVTRIMGMHDSINAEMGRFIDAKEQIIREIRGLHSAKYNRVLYKVYVQYKSIGQAADEMGVSYRYAVQTHSLALKAFGDAYQDLHYLT